MEGLFQWCLVVTVSLVQQGAADPCHPESPSNPEGYVVWDNDGFKRKASDDSDPAIPRRPCDRNLEDHYYRLMHPSGTRLHNTCVQEHHKCGAQYPIWMNGDYPTVAEGLVTRRVCTSYPSIPDCCYLENTIEIKNCGEFYVFKVPASLGCDYAYCFAHENDTTADSQEDVIEPVPIKSTEPNSKSTSHIKVTTVELTLTSRILESTQEQELPVTLKEKEEFSGMTFIVGSITGIVIGVVLAVLTVCLVFTYRKSQQLRREIESNAAPSSGKNDQNSETLGHSYSNESQRCQSRHGNVNSDTLKDISHARENVYTEIEENNLVETVDIIPKLNSMPYYIEITENGNQNTHFPEYLDLIRDSDYGIDGVCGDTQCV